MVSRVVLTFLVLGQAACGDDGTGLESIAGTYTLQTIDGEALPWAIPGLITEITAGSITLNQDMTCSFSSTSKETYNGIVDTNAVTQECSYTFDNGALAIILTMIPDNTLNGSISGSTLTLTLADGEGAEVLSYTK